MGQKHHRRPPSQNEGPARLMLKKIVHRLSQKKLSGWQVRLARKKSFQSFLAKEKLECRRQVETESAVITVYQKRLSPVAMETSQKNGTQKHAHEPEGKYVLGMSSFKVNPQTLPDFDRQLEAALFAADLINNQPFELPEQPSSLPTVQIHDKSAKESYLKQMENRLLQSLAKERKVRLSSAEFFIDQIDTNLINHKGLNVSQNETYLHTEFILLAKSGSQENEYIDRYTRRLTKDFDLEDEVRHSARLAREATSAGLPETGSFPVALTDEPLDHLFNPILARASARLKYNKMLNSKPGEMVLSEGKIKGDKVTLWSNGLLKGGLGSSRFDTYGTPSCRVCLIKENILQHYIADKRYADYLGLPVTGEMGNLELEPGSRKFKELLDPSTWGEKKIYQLIAFSAFEPNPITGAFSAEIRAGYEITAKGKRPIKGGSVSGVLQKDLLHAFMSKERIQRESVLVPRGVLFQNLTIAGK